MSERASVVTETRTPNELLLGEALEVGFAAGVGHKWRVFLEWEPAGWRYVVAQWPNRSEEYLRRSWLKDSYDQAMYVEVFRPLVYDDVTEHDSYEAAMTYAVAEACKEMESERWAE